MENTPNKTIYGAPEFLFALTDLCGLLLEASSDALVAIDTRFQVVLFNDAAERLLQKTRGAVLGKSLFHLLPELGNDDHLDTLSASLRGGRPEEAPLVRGRKRFSWRALPMTDKFGATHGSLLVLRALVPAPDARLASLEQAVLERDVLLGSRARMAEIIIDASSDLMMVVDRNLRYSAVNKALQAYCGRSAEELVGRELLECFPGLAGSGVLAHLQAAFDGQQASLDAIPCILREGHCDIRITPIDYAGHVYGALLVARHLGS